MSTSSNIQQHYPATTTILHHCINYELHPSPSQIPPWNFLILLSILVAQNLEPCAVKDSFQTSLLVYFLGTLAILNSSFARILLPPSNTLNRSKAYRRVRCNRLGSWYCIMETREEDNHQEQEKQEFVGRKCTMDVRVRGAAATRHIDQGGASKWHQQRATPKHYRQRAATG